MSDKPILFSAPMVRALLAGTKTQTRRTLKPQPVAAVTGFQKVFADHPYFQATVNGALLVAAFPDGHGFLSPYPPLRYAIGDRLYVREAYTTTQHGVAVYRADAKDQRGYKWSSIQDGDPGHEVIWKPSIHMPREFSRITLTVTDVRVERLRDISEEDAIAEGIERQYGFWRCYGETPAPFRGAAPTVLSAGRGVVCADPVHSYATLWESINGPGSWDANPWVAAYTFTVRLGNIDQVTA